MMSMGWGFFPWPVLFVIPMIAMAVFMAVGRSQHSGARGPGCGFVASSCHARSAGTSAGRGSAARPP